MQKQELKLTTPLPPSVNDYLGKKVAFNPFTKRYYVQAYETMKAKEFKKAVKYIVNRELSESSWAKTPKGTYVICDLVVYVARARNDSDNLMKCLLDGFIQTDKLVYDDFYIIPRVQDIFIDADNPRIEVTLRESNKKGIFPNEASLEKFEGDNCIECSRSKRNCSIKKSALENRVQKEINMIDFSCSAKKVKK